MFSSSEISFHVLKCPKKVVVRYIIKHIQILLVKPWKISLRTYQVNLIAISMFITFNFMKSASLFEILKFPKITYIILLNTWVMYEQIFSISHAKMGLSRWCSGKESSGQCRRSKMQVPSLGREDSLSRKWQCPPVFLPGKFHGQRNLTGYSPWGWKESDTTEHSMRAYTHTHTHTHRGTHTRQDELFGNILVHSCQGCFIRGAWVLHPWVFKPLLYLF